MSPISIVLRFQYIYINNILLNDEILMLGDFMLLYKEGVVEYIIYPKNHAAFGSQSSLVVGLSGRIHIQPRTLNEIQTGRHSPQPFVGGSQLAR